MREGGNKGQNQLNLNILCARARQEQKKVIHWKFSNHQFS